jgi:type IV secretory pathway VirB6-like protein
MVFKLTRSLSAGPRFRLMLSYALFFTLLLAALGLLFRQVLKTQLDGEVQALLDDDLGRNKGMGKDPERTAGVDCRGR